MTSFQSATPLKDDWDEFATFVGLAVFSRSIPGCLYAMDFTDRAIWHCAQIVSFHKAIFKILTEH